jgi:signal transduction histidine kinase
MVATDASGVLGSDPAALQAVIDPLAAGVALFDGTGRPILHNASFERILGGVPARVQDIRLTSADGSELPREHDPIARALEGTPVLHADLLLRLAGGGARAVRVSATPIGSGTAPAALALTIEEHAAPAEERLLREVLAIVSHDLRNPLSAIRMTAQLLAKAGEVTEDRRVTLSKRVISSSGRLETLVKSLADYARSRAGSIIRLQREPLDLAALARRIAEELAPAYPAHTVEHSVTGDTRGEWDAARLEQIVTQIMGNAYRHGSDSAPVQVMVDGSDADEVRLSVRNGGEPIPDELLARLFEPFQIGRRPAGTPRRHIGLGLFVARELARAHGGSVTGASSAAGTTFNLALPRRPPPDVTSR